MSYRRIDPCPIICIAVLNLMHVVADWNGILQHSPCDHFLHFRLLKDRGTDLGILRVSRGLSSVDHLESQKWRIQLRGGGGVEDDSDDEHRPSAASASFSPLSAAAANMSVLHAHDTDWSKLDKDRVFEGLKNLYLKRVKPLEDASWYSHFSTGSTMVASDFDAKPIVLLLGQYSVGKTSFIRALLGKDFPGMRIGPEPTTDRFVAVLTPPTSTPIQITSPRGHLSPCSVPRSASRNRGPFNSVGVPPAAGQRRGYGPKGGRKALRRGR